jgi:hypothetical protein
VGAVSGGGGNSRLLIDYPEPQRSQILDYLFRPGYGASLQMLKLEIGGDSNSSVGAEPSIEPTQGSVDCRSGYEWWLAEQAVRRNPDLELYGLQWAAPSWVRDTSGTPTARSAGSLTSAGMTSTSPTVFTEADIDYLVDWLDCARSHGLTVRYLGGWNERFHPLSDSAGVAWFEHLRAALDASGYGDVRLVAADAISPDRWSVADVMADHPAFNAAIDVIAVHDACGFPKGPDGDRVPFGYTCHGSTTARRLHKPMWSSENGRLDAAIGAATIIRQLINGYIQSGITGVLEYPLLTAMVDDLPMQNRGLVTAKWPEAGRFTVNRIAWAIAQVTQFVPSGWHYVRGANTMLGHSGSLSSFESPDRHHWSLVAQNTGAYAAQHVTAQRLRVTLAGGLDSHVVHVRATDVWSSDPTTWFRRLPDVHPARHTFSYRIPAGYVVSFTSRSTPTGLGPRTDPARLPAPPAPEWTAVPDGAEMPAGLSPIDGQFLYRPCDGGRTGSCIEQLATDPPIFWLRPDVPPRVPYAVVGQDAWRSYTVGSDVLFTAAGSSAGLISRFTGFGALEDADDTEQFNGYELTLTDTGTWALYRNAAAVGRSRLASGSVPAPGTHTWHRLTLTADGSTLTASVDGRAVTSITDATWRHGLAGIESGWSHVQYDALTISQSAAASTTRPARRNR